MEAIEAEFPPLKEVLPKDYGIFETKVLEDLMWLFNSERVRKASGDVFGRIYEDFLAKFSVQKAHDNGEFFTPSSLVQLIVNVIEPDHGTVFYRRRLRWNVRAVEPLHRARGRRHRQEGGLLRPGEEPGHHSHRQDEPRGARAGREIAEAIMYYQDEHNLGPVTAATPGKCHFVMANPPFNVDLVDAKRIKADPRLPFGLPGVNKDSKVSNGNYLWISDFGAT